MSPIRPRSMPSGQKNVIRPNDSASLWNCTLSPGWTRTESDIFRNALLKFGIGNWRDITEGGCLPGKTNAQLNSQLQRMLGQQSTAEFQGLHIDPLVIGRLNSQKQGPEIKRKSGMIVNTGGKPTREELKRKIQENKENFEVAEDAWKDIELPTTLPVTSSSRHLDSKREQLAVLEAELQRVRNLIAEMGAVKA